MDSNEDWTCNFVQSLLLYINAHLSVGIERIGK